VISLRNRAGFAARRFTEHVLRVQLPDTALHRRIQGELAGSEGRVRPVERVRDLSRQDFLEQYWRTGTPVVLEGLALDWRCVQEWSPRWLAEHYGHGRTGVMDNDNTGERFNVEDLTIAELMERIEAGDTTKYLRFGNLLHLFPELVEDFDHAALAAYRNRLQLGSNMGVFIGAKGTRTTLHAAPPDNLLVQVYGRKRWVLIPASADPVVRPVMARATYYWSDFDPDTNEPGWDAARRLDRWETVLEPGDVLYNPPSTWHKVENLTTSIGVGFRWMSPMAPRLNLSQFLLFFLATNPPLRFVLRNRTSYANVLREAERLKAERSTRSL
jgi:hypothetical protein